MTLTRTLKWWLFFCIQVVVYVLAWYFGIYTMIDQADFMKISFFIMFVHVIGTAWIGMLTRRAEQGQQIDDSTGWFVSEALLTLGMIGTVIGFIHMIDATPVFKATATIDPSTLRDALGGIAKGIGTSLWATLTGLLGSLSIKVQMNNLERLLNETQQKQ